MILLAVFLLFCVKKNFYDFLSGRIANKINKHQRKKQKRKMLSDPGNTTTKHKAMR